MTRRSFLQASSMIGLSLVTTNLLQAEEESVTYFDNSNGNIIINIFCAGGADFRYLFAPNTEQTEYRNEYFSKQSNICFPDDYENTVINNSNYLIRKIRKAYKTP